MDMNIVCLDLEGVLVPEIWIAFAEASGIPELKRTTRDEPDYDKLMKWRLGILKEHGLGLKEIQETIAKIDPIPGAKEFLDELRSITQVIIISDTFSQFAGPLMKKLGYPTIFCNSLEVADNGEITGFKMRVENSKYTFPYCKEKLQRNNAFLSLVGYQHHFFFVHILYDTEMSVLYNRNERALQFLQVFCRKLINLVHDMKLI